ncbi:DUF3040 domain-containing protein [Corynebacterium sp. HS2168-gen11]|uniref:DUF3040 domain-containing protein n=1 Tax=Corynebacterium sp. HS2168-gen11 TaxID=2974027 RepID=UPI00216B56F7|nr:DUF3040 domain-containing protein [Corynebacterium sp. HS2168-gen11]MCS4536184.1 DUF3040 domain-containing protein [Corynebacterium sp. HS2168-gen11]
MALSEYEQRLLREIEQSLLADDPQFGATVQEVTEDRPQGLLTLRGVAIITVGLVLLVAGVALSQISLAFVAVSVLGFLVMVAAGVWMLRASHDAPMKAAAGGRVRQEKRGKGGGFGDRLEDNFKNRFSN